MVRLEDVERLLQEAVGEIEGTDTNDADYHSILDLWKKELNDMPQSSSNTINSTVPRWYSQAYNYWESAENCPINDDGVLGGYGALTPADTKGSNEFLDRIICTVPSFQCKNAADCGAGIGRVTKNFLLPRFNHVDLIEQSPRLLHSAPQYINTDPSRITCVLSGLQEFIPEEGKYDIIWIQWVIGHLHDLDFIEFFKRCAAGLRRNADGTCAGCIVMKENFPKDWTFVVDNNDSSVARCIEYVQVLLQLAGLKVLFQQEQYDFPKELYPVHMFALQPIN